MQDALKQAMIAESCGEVPVGCVIIDRKRGKIIAKTHNNMQKLKNPIAHAEILAINKACTAINNKNLLDCDMYVTLEPCAMCAAAIANARISRLFYGAADLKQGAVENGVKYFANKSCFHRPEIYVGMEEKESRELLQRFFRKVRQDRL